jgi:hypothetical protein
VHHNPANGSPPEARVDGPQQAQQLVVVQRLLAPFVEDLAKTHAELGRVQERLAATERERDELRAAVNWLRADEDAATAQPAAPGATNRAEPGQDASSSWWRRWWRQVTEGR